MGLLSKYKEYQAARLTKKVAKASKLVKNPKAIKEDRWGALNFLADSAEGVERVVEALLPRFQYSLEHGILDSREKDLALKGIVRFGAEAIPVIEAWIKETDRIAWPLKALKAVTDQERIAQVLVAALVLEDVRFDQAKVDKNYDILCYLRDFQIAGHEEQIAHFLQDVDERVRFAASEVLMEQESDAGAGFLEPFLSDESTENRRIKESVIKTFIKRKWVVKKAGSFPNGMVSPQVAINGKGVLEARV